MDARFPTRTTAHRGFTLVELLVVITIIGILASLITAAGVAAIGQAKRTTIKMDISQLETAVHAYKEKYGDYPPDFFDTTTPDGKSLVLRHLRKAFPRYILSGNTANQWDEFRRDVNAYATAAGLTLNVNNLSPPNAIAFWLGGLPDNAGRLTGFSADPANPFRPGGSRLDPLFEFDQTRLFAVNGWPAYKSEHLTAAVPYVYFRVRVCPHQGNHQYEFDNGGGRCDMLFWNAGNAGICVPYRTQGNDKWNKPKSFQIISPGMDGRYGSFGSGDSDFRDSATGGNFTPGDYDNITNFSSNTLEDGLE